MSRAILITNPKASRSGGAGLGRAVAHLRARGMEVQVRPTDAAGHGTALAREAMDTGADLLIAHGGDGTIMEVAAALVGTAMPLGLLPAGTGNRLADNLGVRWQPVRAAETILAGHTRRIDVGRLTTTSGVRYFAVAAGCGVDAELMHRTSPRQKRLLGVGAYFTSAVAMIGRVTRARVRLELESGTRETWAASIIIANCGEVIPLGPGFGAHVQPDDGWFDVILLDASDLFTATRVGLSLWQGKTDPAITFLRARHVRIETDPVLAAQGDGETAGTTPLTAELVRQGLTVLAPPA